uniref:Uncharacterized protein n=1 Tax=Solanum lycopersicum TaxID=4081 RepID=A0A3Q7GIM2_SOLLC
MNYPSIRRMITGCLKTRHKTINSQLKNQILGI